MTKSRVIPKEKTQEIARPVKRSETNGPEQGTKTGHGGVAALERGLLILRAFETGRRSLTLNELSKATGLYKSTILRLLESLIRFGYVSRSEDGSYRLGATVFVLGRHYQAFLDRRDLIERSLKRLVGETGETASFYIREGNGDICLYRRESLHPVRDGGVRAGDRLPIDGSAGSFVLDIFSRRHQVAGGDPDRYRLVFSRCSKRFPGVSALICPVFGIDNGLSGILVLSGPESRFGTEHVSRCAEVLLGESEDLTRILGGDFSYDGVEIFEFY